MKLPQWMYRDKISPILHGLWTTIPGLALAYLWVPLGAAWVNWWWGFYGCKELGPNGDLRRASKQGLVAKVRDSGEDILVPSLFAICANVAIWTLL